MNRITCKQRGITLLEAAIVLSLLSFLAGATMSIRMATEWISAKQLVREMQGVKDMLYIYRERFNAVPGDDANASSHLTGATSAFPTFIESGGNMLISGGYEIATWEGFNIVNQLDEPSLFWQHVRLAGLAPGDPAQGYALNAVGGRLGITSGVRLPTRPAGATGFYAVCSSKINGKVARMMDAELDDGDATTGKVWGAVETNGPVITPTPTSPYRVDIMYTVCMAF